MIELRPIDRELKRYVEIAYKGDEDLLSKYHVAEYTLDEAVEETLRMIYSTSLEVESNGDKMYNFYVSFDNKPIGYLSVFKNNLYSFGINIEYRTKEILSDFWNEIKEVLGNNFMSVLYPNNTRAIGYLQKCGMVSKECVILLYNS
jgi:hypothetical protein